MAATLTIIYWRDIPAQVTARNGDDTHKLVLHPRFQAAIDRAAMKAGKSEFDDYIGEWRRESEPCGDDVEAEATARAAALEAAYPKAALDVLVANGGLRSASDA